MIGRVEFKLDPEAAPGFLRGAFIERESENIIAIGVSQDGGDYAYARMTLDQFRAACRMVDPQ